MGENEFKKKTLAPSKSTVYLSNFSFSLKTNDLHQLFSKYGKIVKVTVVKDRITRKSKGVAFILFLNQDDARKCVAATNNQEMSGRTLKASIAKDNGRTTEFLRKRTYPDKSQCYECGEKGHLSYSCSRNLLGAREPPPKKKKVKKKIKDVVETEKNEEENEEDEDYEDFETLSAAIALEQEKHCVETLSKSGVGSSRKKYKKSEYFSDEEEIE